MIEIEKIQRDTYNSVVFRTYPQTYLVGGFIRDLFIGKESNDRDYALTEDPTIVAHAMKEHFTGAIVNLKDEATVRLAIKNGITLDFTRYERDIRKDILRRDYTFNAVSYSPAVGIHDPLGGLTDLKERRVKMVKEENLKEDPVRILRAYRFVGELNADIEDRTRTALRTHKELLSNSASERITLEFFKLLQSTLALKALKYAYNDKILDKIISINNSKLDAIMVKLFEVYEKLKESPEDFLTRPISQGLTLQGLILLQILLMRSDPERSKLSLSKRVSDRVLHFQNIKNKQLSEEAGRADIFDYFVESFISLDEKLAVDGRLDLVDLSILFYEISRKPLLNGHALKKHFHLKEGPIVGKLLYEVKKAQFSGLICDREQAIKYVKRYLDAQGL
jgi:tRNA nucleotidyltransferase/poly(A) polymerase